MLLAPGRMAGQQAATASPDDSANHVETALAGVTLSGYAEASYSYSTHPSGNVIVGRLYDRFNDQFMLNALKLVLDKPSRTDKFDAGFHTDIVFGQNATPIQSTGLKLGDQGDLMQLYVTLNVPTPNGHGVQFRAGKMVSLMGVEGLDDVLNPTWSEGYQAIFVENATATGLDVDYKFNSHVETDVRVSNGWDKVQAVNGGKTFAVQLRITPDSESVLALLGYVGPQEPNNDTAQRYGLQAVVNRKLTRRLTAWIQSGYGREQANAALPDSTRDAIWWAVGGWLTWDFTTKVALAFRGDYLNDEEGARTSAVFGFPANTGQKLGSATATVNIRGWPNALLRPEVRYDRSSLNPFGDKNDQVSVALSVAYLY
jgi:hypothetical protein